MSQCSYSTLIILIQFCEQQCLVLHGLETAVFVTWFAVLVAWWGALVTWLVGAEVRPFLAGGGSTLGVGVVCGIFFTWRKTCSGVRIVLVSTFTWYIAMVSYCHRHLDIGTLTWVSYFLQLLLIISSAEHTLPLFCSVTKHKSCYKHCTHAWSNNYTNHNYTVQVYMHWCS